ncbi:MAG: hypothetical protein BGO98_41050 [Myxococcales bacterium 68-20]|nr:sigma-70 family RNA polymerase sigma factor [Myxococcales bacterium]OJY27654.1 MAG: hypothetical protein BGO98_41050 [Myxococcales bacterium 68-20]
MNEGRIDVIFEAGKRAWPALLVPRASFVAAVKRHAEKAASTEPVVESANAADFYLAVACVEGVKGAASAFRKHVLVHVPAYVGTRAPAEDVEQLVAMRLLLPDGDRPPQISEYSGKGSLGAWVRVVATRIALNLRRKKEVPEEVALIPLGTAPEVDFSRFRYKTEFKAAFEHALGELSADERLLLRLHSIERMRGEDIARLFEVDRSTVMRRLAHARETLFELTRAVMMQKLRLSTEEFESFARDVQSGIDLTLSRVFA